MPRVSTKFNNDWVKDFQWVEPVEKDVHKAKCKLCRVQFSVAIQGRQAILQHQNRNKHQENENAAAKTIPIDKMFVGVYHVYVCD